MAWQPQLWRFVPSNAGRCRGGGRGDPICQARSERHRQRLFGSWVAITFGAEEGRGAAHQGCQLPAPVCSPAPADTPFPNGRLRRDPWRCGFARENRRRTYLPLGKATWPGLPQPCRPPLWLLFGTSLVPGGPQQRERLMIEPPRLGPHRFPWDRRAADWGEGRRPVGPQAQLDHAIGICPPSPDRCRLSVHECATVATVVGSHLVDPAIRLNAAPVDADRRSSASRRHIFRCLDTH